MFASDYFRACIHVGASRKTCMRYLVDTLMRRVPNLLTLLTTSPSSHIIRFLPPQVALHYKRQNHKESKLHVIPISVKLVPLLIFASVSYFYNKPLWEQS